MKYLIQQQQGKTFIWAGDETKQAMIEIDPSEFNPESVIKIFQVNEVSPEHIQNVYDDLIFKKNML